VPQAAEAVVEAVVEARAGAADVGAVEAVPRGVKTRGTVGDRDLLPWRSGSTPSAGRPAGFPGHDALEVARGLLGCRLISTVGGLRTSGVIVETEAYEGARDPASHACTVTGRTKRNAVMFGLPGLTYVYRIYGMHWCMNVVTGCDGQAGAVLIRGLDALEGQEVMRERRGREPLTTGPGRLCQALGITGGLYGHDLRVEPLKLRAGWGLAPDLIGVSTRIGVRAAADWPYRFYVPGAPGVSRHPATPDIDPQKASR
jgi:DNA-3-methyladenine glycosylase